MKKVLLAACLIAAVLQGLACVGGKVTEYEEARITAFAWSGDTLVAYVRDIERGFVAGGVKRNPKLSVELWLAAIDPTSGQIDSNFRVRQLPTAVGQIEFYSGGRKVLYTMEKGLQSIDLQNGECEDFFTDPAILDIPARLSVGPSEKYLLLIAKAEFIEAPDKMLNLFMVDISKRSLEFHTDSLVDERAFLWLDEDRIAFVTIDHLDPTISLAMQFGIIDRIVRPADLSVDQVRQRGLSPEVSPSGKWSCQDEKGKLRVKPNTDRQ